MGLLLSFLIAGMCGFEARNNLFDGKMIDVRVLLEIQLFQRVTAVTVTGSTDRRLTGCPSYSSRLASIFDAGRDAVCHRKHKTTLQRLTDKFASTSIMNTQQIADRQEEGIRQSSYCTTKQERF